MAISSIEWTEMTWNPTTGCNKVSSGCKHCYAETLTKRLQAMGQVKYKDGFELRIHEESLNVPFTWRRRKIVFVNSMSDLFHDKVPTDFIQRVFWVMNSCSQHTFQVLTKRAERLLEISSTLNWTPNIWMGVSVENESATDRIDFLRKTGAKTKFLSCEPLIGPLRNLDLNGIDWIIVGGESGPKSRPIKESWVWDIRLQSQNAGVAFFFKQWGGFQKSRTGRLLGGRTYDEMPALY